MVVIVVNQRNARAPLPPAVPMHMSRKHPYQVLLAIMIDIDCVLCFTHGNPHSASTSVPMMSTAMPSRIQLSLSIAGLQLLREGDQGGGQGGLLGCAALHPKIG